MKLLLTSVGLKGGPEIKKIFRDLLGEKPHNARIFFITTAAAGGPDWHRVRKQVRQLVREGIALEHISIFSLDRKIKKEDLENIDLIYVSGGNSFLYLDKIRKTGLDKEIKRLVKKGAPVSDLDWEIYPEGLSELLLRLHHEYCLPPTYISENGAAFNDVCVDGQVKDTDRIDYLATHITAVHEAIQQGVPMAGYMVWSLLDNFEWSSGYEKRFGIFHVDYDTQKRTAKDSALWYRDFLYRQKALRQNATQSEG